MDTKKYPYGTHSVTKLLNEDGGKVTTKTNYIAGKPTTPVRNIFELPQRVHSQAEEHAAYLQFSDELRSNPNMLDASWRIEQNSAGKEKGYYYVVKCYTQLEY